MQRTLLVAVGACLLALLVSCGQSPSLTVQLGSTTLSIVRGAQDTVAITVVRPGGGTDPVALTLSGVPSNVTATFTNDTLNAGQTSSTLQLQVDAAATEAVSTLTVHATSGSLAASADLTLDVTSLTVNGTLHALRGDGFPGGTVAIQGTTTTSDANGAFTIAGVSVPYDVIVYSPTGFGTAAHVFVGMTSATPVIGAFGPLQASADTGYYPGGTIKGDLSAPVPAGSRAAVCTEGVGTVVYGCAFVAAGNTAYTINASWVQGGSASYTLHALVVQLDANDLPTGYDAYGSASGTVADGGTTTTNIALGAPPATANMTLTTNYPPGFNPSTVGVGARLGPTFTLPIVTSGLVAATSITIPMAQFSGATYSALVLGRAGSSTAAAAGWDETLSGVGTSTLTLPSPPTLIAPADGATGVGVGDTLEVANANGSAITFQLSDATSDYVLITTMASSATIPDLSVVGAGLAPATAYQWLAYTSPTSSTIDEAAERWLTDYYAALLALNSGGTMSGVAAGAITQTESRSFTTP